MVAPVAAVVNRTLCQLQAAGTGTAATGRGTAATSATMPHESPQGTVERSKSSCSLIQPDGRVNGSTVPCGDSWGISRISLRQAFSLAGIPAEPRLIEF